ncbi:hypothetical protein [Jeotgalibaca porci]|uniref:hypothetical protein n=1 Tax=Jeotgalibaca porci TaxID=1868793 RepID=UPI0035A091B3
MKNLLSVENLVSTTAKEARLFDLEFFVGGKRVFIKGAKLYGNSGMPFDDYLNYWNDEANLKRAIDEAKRIETVETKLFNEKPGDFKMKNLLNWNNFVAVSEGENGAFDLEFHVQGLLMVIRNAEMYDRPLIDGVIQHPLLYWHEKQNIERAIELAESEEVEIMGDLDKLAEENELEEYVEEISDITTDINNMSANLECRLGKIGLALQNHQGNVKVIKKHQIEKEAKNEVALTARQLADLGETLLTNKRMLEFQNHALALVKPPKEIDREDLIIHYHELYRLTEDMFGANQEVVRTMDMAAFLLLESTNKDEIDAHYNE